MTTKTNLKRIREILITDNTNEFTDNISEDDESNSDPDYSFSDTESDDTSTDERISNEEDSSDAHISNDDTQINAQPESIEKGGVSWSTQRPTVQGRVHAINIMKTKPGPVTQLPQHFIPSENLTIDEQLVPFRGRCSFVQYMPKKPSKYGLKFWVLCDVDSRYVLALELYTGKIGNVIQRNLATNVVLRLVDQLPNKVKQGRNVTYDRFFSDFHLAQALLERKMTSLGVVNHKRCFIPNELKVIRNDLYSSWFYFAGQTMILSYQAKQKKPPVILLSTLHDFPEILDDEKKLPAMIHDYNETKIGVDVVKLALQSLGYELKPEISLAQVNTNDVIKIKKRCYLCPVNPGRKVRQSCDICQNNVCNSHSSSSTTVICQECEKMM
ncbi:unnamed protein product [Rotaria sordida]|uniref:PiggyBac transposable element-derived protein domain-containing protein n=1 Tax=Rotaria sordida TaxID=392033 RepID=A0A816B0W9_9BILA|nr:unnamed protein product [Rotaria sordida]CAF1604596.1 unnamed protein product [Rotaria sordida]